MSAKMVKRLKMSMCELCIANDIRYIKASVHFSIFPTGFNKSSTNEKKPIATKISGIICTENQATPVKAQIISVIKR